MSIAEYMDLCLAHPEFGYYRSRDPFGREGDFTTAPEISQLFGEMIGIWVATIWMHLNKPERIILCEFGPGRGTLMSDLLRVANVLGMKDKAEIHFVETSDFLIEKQKEAVTDAKWHSSIETVPQDAPVIFIGNEFLDALPIKQIVKTKEGWRERVVGLEHGKLVFGLGGALSGSDLPEAKENEIYEFSPARENIWMEICRRIEGQTGAALMIDYGYVEAKLGNTLQAVKNHSYAGVLENPGEQDLTSHVDFGKLKQIVDAVDLHGPVTQSEFLKSVGIEARAEKLIELNPDKSETIKSGLKRLIHRDGMGNLFKVIAVTKGI